MGFMISEVVGAIAYILLGISYFRKHKKEILFVQIFAYIMFSLHYYLLDGITGAICNILGLVALVVIYFFDQYQVKNKKWLIVGMIPIFVAIALVSYQNIYSLLPIVASVATIASFLTSKERIIRGIGIISAVCWLVYAITLHSVVSIISEIFILIFVSIAFVKNEKKGESKWNN